MFEENYEWFKSFLRGRFRNLNDYDIEDIIQQSALNLIHRGENIGGIKNLTSYVFSSLENGAKDLFRKRKRETLTGEETEQSGDSLEQAVLIAEFKRAVMKAIGTLDEKQRYVFVETEFKGRSYEELARETGEKLGTLLSRKSRALTKIRSLVYDYIDKED